MLDCLSYYISCILYMLISIQLSEWCLWMENGVGVVTASTSEGNKVMQPSQTLTPWSFKHFLKAWFVYVIFFWMLCSSGSDMRGAFPYWLMIGSALLSIFSRVDKRRVGQRVEGVQFKHRTMFALSKTLSVCAGPALLLKKLTPDRNNLRREERLMQTAHI